MNIDNFVATSNFITRRDYNARCVSTRRAFFMPNRQVIDSIDKNLSAACLKWYSVIRISIFRLAMSCLLAVKRAAVFYCPRLTSNSIMSKTTQPTVTVKITPVQEQILDFYLDPRDAATFAATLRAVCIASLTSPICDNELTAQVLQFAELVQSVSVS